MEIAPELLLEELRNVLEKLGITLETRNLDDEELTIKSGYCEVRKEQKLIIDKRYPASIQAKTIIDFLKNENLDGIYIPPRVREIIESGGA